jgi:hypothetical protein
MRLIALYPDARIEDVVLREADALGEALEQLADLFVALGRADAGTFPDTVLRKDTDDAVLIVIVVADIAILGLELLDRLDIFEEREVSRELAIVHDEDL